MGQEPNLELESTPSRVATPGAPRRWSPDRPGEIKTPADMRWGGAFGRPGPDTGWALKLIRQADWDRSSRVKEIEQVLTAFVGARASMFGRAPTPLDVEVGLLLFGLRPDDVPPAVAKRLADERNVWLDKAAHEHSKGSQWVTSIDNETMVASPDRIRTVLAQS